MHNRQDYKASQQLGALALRPPVVVAEAFDKEANQPRQRTSVSMYGR
jgi:hypothetical protein